MTRVIGLTGGIATGKSTVAEYLASVGYEIIDADKITHQVQSKGSKGLEAIAAFFGKDIIKEDGELNRQKLGSIVFNNKSKLIELTRIIDPFIRSEVIRRINETTNEVVILDAPTLFENGYHFMCDDVISVVCDFAEQEKRLMERDSLSKEDADARIKSQWPLKIKAELSTYVIDSNGSIMQTRNQVVKLFNNID
ncbi:MULTISPECIES: dephospho-CoA kinase [Lactobacillaceae]|uniref:dephospho-CoA kinase n=1 Tax=Lactobacillaceae TaxID=33958 RepID=UPI0006CE6CE6|nr:MULTISPECIES: dephospho-CoA kinase [Lactobacillaceae]MCX8743375.1 dephospho-CoA kinase [Lactobacillus sp. B3795]